jgi:uncharacterized protein
MAERLAFDTSPLIALASAGALSLLERLPIEPVAPHEVERELKAGFSSGYPEFDLGCVQFVQLARPVSQLTLAQLDEGEAAVIQLALDSGIRTVCIDERKGRRAALAVGLRVVGTLGLLGRAKTLGLVASVRPFVEQLQTQGTWFDDNLVARVLSSLGE